MEVVTEMRLKPIEIKQYRDGVPYVARKFTSPPGYLNPDMFKKHGLYTREEIPFVIEKFPLTDGQKTLLTGLLTYGGIAFFGTHESFNLGLDYNNVLKYLFRPDIVEPGLTELADELNKEPTYRVDGVLVPENSAIKPGTLFANLSGKIPIISVRKNGQSQQTGLEVAIDSYTKGKTDFLSIDESTLEAMKKQHIEKLVLTDDIVDTGAMTEAIALILQLAREKGYNVNLSGIITPFEKRYTKAREHIQTVLGNVPVKSILQIEDIGLGPIPWIKIIDIEEAIPCNFIDLRH